MSSSHPHFQRYAARAPVPTAQLATLPPDLANPPASALAHLCALIAKLARSALAEQVAFDAAGPMPSGAGGQKFSNPMHAVGAMYPFNFSGHPAAVLRCPGELTADEGLPPGSIQVVAERHRDDLVLQVAAVFEANTAPLAWPQVDEEVPAGEAPARL